ncbi:DUF2490 domain-containing protein [Algibacter mikhailovii]|uniref:DUF2490 domain-containing protein n=1 Tax=Algibacter mikhailovii TaxID=425498 RepID=A0A918R8I1_9FLAO|nr:DUF2490 domain-containing protein [Algibacter mikhailovii]GGZ89451.1 hypothetical protein GCM10007028_29660 [Algibacter mikhailovii]
MKPIYYFLFLFLLFHINAVSQDQEEQNVKVNAQLWLDYNFQNDLGDFKTLNSFVGYRSITPNIYNNFLVVSTYNIANQNSVKFLKREKPFFNSYHFGARANYIANKNKKDDFEFRLMQGIKFYLPFIKDVPLMNYIRLEERFQKTFDTSGWDIGFRFRYKISTVLDLDKHLFNFTTGFYIPMNVEFFFNLKKVDRFNDVIRISPGIGYKLNEDWKFEFYVSYQNTQNTSQTENTSNDFVFRLRIFKLSSKKNKTIQSKDEQIKELIE